MGPLEFFMFTVIFVVVVGVGTIIHDSIKDQKKKRTRRESWEKSKVLHKNHLGSAISGGAKNIEADKSAFNTPIMRLPPTPEILRSNEQRRGNVCQVSEKELDYIFCEEKSIAVTTVDAAIAREVLATAPTEEKVTAVLKQDDDLVRQIPVIDKKASTHSKKNPSKRKTKKNPSKRKTKKKPSKKTANKKKVLAQVKKRGK